jgi:hypothetical protein
MNRKWLAAFSIAAAVALLAAVWWLQVRPSAPVAAAPAPSVAQAVASPASVPLPDAAVRYPIEAASEPGAASPPGIESALSDLFGARAVQSMFQLDEFPRRFVATVDNLGRSQASSRLWPLQPTTGRFSVDRADGDSATIAVGNAARYAPFVSMIEHVDLRRAVAAYAQHYPSFQRAYEDLGYPRRYFNDRLVEVVDHLLATPEPATPPKVHLARVNGPVALERPWLFYEFDDPALESLSSGQKILLRMGVANERRVKARLVELRQLITSSAAPR